MYCVEWCRRMTEIDLNEVSEKYSKLGSINYAEEIATILSKVQPMPDDMRLLFPDLLKDFKNESK